MEYVETISKSIEMAKNIWSGIRDYFNYKKILEEKRPILKRKLDRLSDRENDIKAELESSKYFAGKKQRKEVETWLKKAQHKTSEVLDLEQKVDRTGYFWRPHCLRLVGKSTAEVDELVEEGKFPEGLFIDVHQDREEAFLTTPLVGQSIMESNLREIWECVENDGITRVGVYGMGGVGKTTVVTHIHNQLLKSTRTFDHVYWVTVSQESSIHKLQDSIAKVVRLFFRGERDQRKRAAQLFKVLTERKKFVLILDDMWTHFPPEDVGIPIGVDAGKLIVTSRSLKVCQRMNCQQNIQVQPLPTNEAWDLFMEKLGHETVLTPQVEEIARSIAKECAGLPLAIVTTAGSMKGVDDIREWRNALNELSKPTKGAIDLENEVFNKLKFSYDRLSDENLQKCFLYCALFPEDYKIQREYLIMCWIAEGLIDEMTTRQEEFDRGHTLLNLLEKVCLLEHTKDSSGKICVKMHDVMRDMAINITRVNPQFMVKVGLQLMELPDEREWSENLERVSLMHNDLRGQFPAISPKCPRLRTLMLQSLTNYLPSVHFLHQELDIPISLFVYLKDLRVLDLSHSGIFGLPESISNLEKLRVLLLRGCRYLRYVPSLEKLTEMRELDLLDTAIEKLPHGMEKLVYLKRLELSRVDDMTDDSRFVYPSVLLPNGILPKLSHLQSLRVLQFTITDDVHVEEIVSLRQLEVLFVCFYNLPIFNRYVNTRHWQRLSEYSLQTVKKNLGLPTVEKNSGLETVIGNFRRPGQFGGVLCREVHIEGEDPVVLPTNIQQLTICACHRLTSLSDISSLNNARELERCWIHLCQGMEHLWCTDTNTSLESLRTLMLKTLPNLRVIFNFQGVGVGGAQPRRGTFSNLKLFTVGECQKLKYLFTRGLLQHQLQNLEVIHVYTCFAMENIVVDEGEEKQEEILAANGGDNNSIITCPKLQSLELRGLPKLKSIWRGTMVCHSLQQIEVRDCPMLKRLPLSLHLNDDPRTPPTHLALKKIRGEQNWWDSLEWDHPDAKSVLQLLLDTHQTSPFWGDSTANGLWRKDAKRYEK